MDRCTDADAVSCVVHTLVLEPPCYLSSVRLSVLLSRVLTVSVALTL